MAIAVRNVTKRFGDFVALDDVSIEVASGSLTALLGPSGSGKSTLLRVIAGLEAPDAGDVFISGEEATATAPQKRGVGFVFQHYAPFKHMTVCDNIAFGLTIRHRPKAEIRARVAELLELVQLAGPRRPLPVAALGRAAAAHGARARARRRAGGAAARRAVRRARRARPQGAARVAAPPPRRDARDDDLRHARPGGGDGARRRRRRHERGPRRAGGAAARALRRARESVRDELRRAGEPARRRVGAPARHRDHARAERADARGAGRAHRPPRVRGARRRSCATTASACACS